VGSGAGRGLGGPHGARSEEDLGVGRMAGLGGGGCFWAMEPLRAGTCGGAQIAGSWGA
jgi:hypothetical protein